MDSGRLSIGSFFGNALTACFGSGFIINVFSLHRKDTSQHLADSFEQRSVIDGKLQFKVQLMKLSSEGERK